MIEKRHETMLVGNAHKDTIYDGRIKSFLEGRDCDVSVIGFPEDLNGITWDQLRSHFSDEIAKNGRKTNLSGWSFGANAGLGLVAERNEYIERFTAMAPMPGARDYVSLTGALKTTATNFPGAMRLLFRKNANGLMNFSAREKKKLLYSNVTAEEQVELETHLREAGEELCREGFLWTLYGQGLNRGGNYKIPEGSTVPIQFIIGENDPLISVQSVRKHAKRHKYQGLEGEVHVMEGMHHGLPYEIGRKPRAKSWNDVAYEIYRFANQNN